jgi:hypothetical protein
VSKSTELAVIPDVSPLHHETTSYLSVDTLPALGTSFCGIPPEETADDQLLRLIVPSEDVDYGLRKKPAGAGMRVFMLVSFSFC